MKWKGQYRRHIQVVFIAVCVYAMVMPVYRLARSHRQMYLKPSIFPETVHIEAISALARRIPANAPLGFIPQASIKSQAGIEERSGLVQFATLPRSLVSAASQPPYLLLGLDDDVPAIPAGYEILEKAQGYMLLRKKDQP